MLFAGQKFPTAIKLEKCLNLSSPKYCEFDPGSWQFNLVRKIALSQNYNDLSFYSNLKSTSFFSLVRCQKASIFALITHFL